jgi:hypothetical protein
LNSLEVREVEAVVRRRGYRQIIEPRQGRRLLGWSLQELAARSGVNWLTIKKYEGAGAAAIRKAN